MVAGGEFREYAGTNSKRRCSHKENDTRLILYASEALVVGYHQIFVM